MGEIAIAILRMTAKYVFFIAMITSFIIVLNLILSTVFIGFNAGVFSDLTAIVSMWLPFNLSTVMIYLMATSTAYIMYRLSVKSVVWLNGFLGK